MEGLPFHWMNTLFLVSFHVPSMEQATVGRTVFGGQNSHGQCKVLDDEYTVGVEHNDRTLHMSLTLCGGMMRGSCVLLVCLKEAEEFAAQIEHPSSKEGFDTHLCEWHYSFIYSP